MRLGFIAMSVAAVAAVGSSLAHAAIAWSPASGSLGATTYANGQNTVGYLGTPVLDGSGFVFAPGSFASSSANLDADSVSDTADVDLTHVAVSKVTVRIYGDFVIDGSGSADAQGVLTLTNLGTVTAPLTRLLTFTGTPAITSAGMQGSFSGTATIPLPRGWERVHVSFTSTLSTSSSAGGAAFIQAKLAEIEVPEPTLAIATGAIGLVAMRRRR